MSLHSTNYKVKRDFLISRLREGLIFLICSTENTFILFPLTLFQPLPSVHASVPTMALAWWGVAKYRMFIWHHAGWRSPVLFLSLSDLQTCARSKQEYYGFYFLEIHRACDETIHVETKCLILPYRSVTLHWLWLALWLMFYYCFIAVNFGVEPDVLCGCRWEVLSCLGSCC